MDGLLNSAKASLSGMMGNSTSTPPAQQGGSKYRNGRRKRGYRGRSRSSKRGGSSVVATAALPFGLLALQKFFHTRKGRKDLNQMKNTVKAPFTRRRKRRR